MVQQESRLLVADNSGAKKIRVIQVFGGTKRRFGHVGDMVIASVVDADPNGTVQRGEKVPAVIVRPKKEQRRSNSEYIRFDKHAAVIVQARNNKEPLGTRVVVPIAREIKDQGYNKIASLAPEVL